MSAALIDILVLVIPSLLVIFLSEPGLLSDTASHEVKPLTNFLLAALWIVYQGGWKARGPRRRWGSGSWKSSSPTFMATGSHFPWPQ